jgi:hypothetical protein
VALDWRAGGGAAQVLPTKRIAVIVTVLWWVLIGGGVIMEIVARRRPRIIAPLSRVGARLASALPGRVALWAGWIFVGLHLFTRYTLPRH